MKLPNYFIKKKIQERIEKSRNRSHNFCSLQDSHTIMLMFNIHDFEAVEPCIRQLNKASKKVLICTYIPKGYNAKTDEAWLQIDEEKDTNIKKLPSHEICNKINKQPVDILINLTRLDDYVMHYLLLQHPAPFKVGQKVYLQNIHDFEIAMTDNNDISELFNQILFYLQTIRTK